MTQRTRRCGKCGLEFTCAVQIDWIKGRCSTGALVPDHLDGDKANNVLSNLVPSCNRCNTARGLFLTWVTKHQDDPLLWRMYLAAKNKTA